jgi:hypothetical protein
VITGIIQHELSRELVGALPHPQDIEQATRLELGQGLGTDQLRSATKHTRAVAKRPRSRSMTGIRVVTSAVLLGHIS